MPLGTVRVATIIPLNHNTKSDPLQYSTTSISTVTVVAEPFLSYTHTLTSAAIQFSFGTILPTGDEAVALSLGGIQQIFLPIMVNIVPSTGSSLTFVEGSFAVPTDKISKFRNAIRIIPPFWRCPVRAVVSVVGQVITKGCAIGPVARLCTRALYMQTINKRLSWSSQLMLSEEACEELQLWQQHMHSLNSQLIWVSTGAPHAFFFMSVLLVMVAMWLS